MVVLPENDVKAEQLLSLWVAHQAHVYRFVYSMVPHASDAQDILQATCIALWRKSASLDLERPFLPLAYSFASIEIRRHRQTNRRWATAIDDSLLDLLLDERTKADAHLQARCDALQDCVKKLPAGDRELLQSRYERDCSVEDISAASGRKLFTVYKHLQRLRHQLWECINTTLQRGRLS